MAQNILLVLMILMANLPFLSENIFFVFRQKESTEKSVAWCSLEFLVYYGVFIAIASFAENMVFGNIARQGWEYFAVTLSLFFVFGFPGYVYKYLVK